MLNTTISQTMNPLYTPVAASTTIAPAPYPTVSEDEIDWLARRYGQPRRLKVTMPACPEMIKHRFLKKSDRRAEVVFAVQRPNGTIWVHAKKHYPAYLYRIPSGGICWDEKVESALLREVGEETSLAVGVERFLGVIEYFFQYEGRTEQFASYVFHLVSNGDTPVPVDPDEIASFQAILPSQLLQISADLRNILGPRNRWGMWRALSHDLVHESLAQ